LSTPYERFSAAGHELTIASPAGGAVAPDPASLEEPFLSDSGRRVMADPAFRELLEHSVPLSEVDGRHFDAIFLVGGVGAAYDFDNNPELNRIITEMVDRKAVVSGLCHGVIGLSTAQNSEGTLLAYQEKMTGFSRAEEIAFGLLDAVPVVPEDRLRGAGATYQCAAEPFDACVEVGSKFITGQNPASAGPLAEAVLARLLRD
jgi:putative intracellular protease/amidase